MTAVVETRPAWVAAASRFLGDPAEPATYTCGSMYREIWDWRGANTLVVVDRLRDTTTVEVSQHGAVVWETRTSRLLDDDRIVDLLRVAGVLPRLVPATDRYREGMWLDAHDELRWTYSRGAGEAAAAAGYRRLYVEGDSA